MPELHSGLRRDRRAPVDQRHRQTKKKPAQLVGNYVKTRAAVAREAAEAKAKAAARKASAKKRKEVVVILEDKEVEVGERKGREGLIEERERMGDESGGSSANKVTGKEEEGTTSPFPDKV